MKEDIFTRLFIGILCSEKTQIIHMKRQLNEIGCNNIMMNETRFA